MAAGTVPSRVQMFIPIFSPATTGSPACSARGSPTALPCTGRNVTPRSHGSSQSVYAHHWSVGRGALTSGKFVPPPRRAAGAGPSSVVPFDTCTYAKKLDTRLPPCAAVACTGCNGSRRDEEDADDVVNDEGPSRRP
ncbi:hypothetical protein SPBR_08732 [Sporothrix brasiliensis 5110]|uniref:Uncharacterized protein n=1 Tax=Sporothrix brasiliensis 5110 TaxID=1398154 RepID=A0A0C2EL60_9PEZI|nr:uncharacterized protein SPBR_08732 [Sporothrix brasiliensis 5110]KIH86819.1 hypothetical protein SPBR_08732 [Sporothrix brasiliensis 5110]